MRVPAQTISQQISKLTYPLTRSSKAVAIDIRRYASCRTKYHNYRSILFQLLPNSCTVWRFFSTRSVTFDNQPPSWLFISDAVSGAYGAQVNLELDLDDRLSGTSLEKLKSDLKLRGLQFDIDDLVKDFRELRGYEKSRDELIANKETILAEMKLLREENKSDDVQMSQQKLYEKLCKIKADLSIQKPLWGLESKVMLRALKLPNDLHDSTPATEDLIIREVRGNKDPPSTQSHVEIAKKFDLIKFSNVGPKAYYLKGELVLAEMALINTACAYLESKNYRHMIGPDFFKTPIMEGCGLDIHNPDEVLTMLDKSKDVVEPLNHLAGVSLPVFAAFVAKTCIGNSILPFSMFTCGSSFQHSDLPGLLGATQTTQATVFSCVSKDNQDSQFHHSVDVIWDFLEPFGFPLRILQICARNLRREERRRLEIQMFIPSQQQFVPVAHVSDLSDFVSRRLMVIHNKNHADIRSASIAHMVSGTLLNITSLLAIWLEYSNTNQATFSLCPLASVQKSGIQSL